MMTDKIMCRGKTLAELAVQKTRLVMPLQELRGVDRDLVESWGVDFLGEDQNLNDLLAIEADFESYAKYQNIMEDVETANRQGVKDTITVEQELFTIMAKHPFLGYVTSKRRATIIDSIALVEGLIRELTIRGPVLDVGTHVGIVPLALANRLPNEFVGIDPCAAAIETGRELSSNTKNVQLDIDSVPLNSDRLYEMVVAVGAMGQTPSNVAMFLRDLGKRLEDGGVAVIVSTYWHGAKIETLRRQLRNAKLGFGLVDVVGGFEGAPPSYGVTGALVLVKGGNTTVPRGLTSAFESNWKSFYEYANMPVTPLREMTQAFHRSKEQFHQPTDLNNSDD